MELGKPNPLSVFLFKTSPLSLTANLGLPIIPPEEQSITSTPKLFKVLANFIES